MKLVWVVLLFIIGGGLWVIGTRLSDDALGLVIGFIFGVLAGIPSCMMVLASQRRSEPKQREYDHPQYPMILVQGDQRGFSNEVRTPRCLSCLSEQMCRMRITKRIGENECENPLDLQNQRCNAYKVARRL